MKKFFKKAFAIVLCTGILVVFGTCDNTAYARTSKGVASTAGKILRNDSSGKGAKSVAGSALSQRNTRRSK